jgi:hypothetical protein
MPRFMDFHHDLKLPAEAIAQVAGDTRNKLCSPESQTESQPDQGHRQHPATSFRWAALNCLAVSARCWQRADRRIFSRCRVRSPLLVLNTYPALMCVFDCCL